MPRGKWIRTPDQNFKMSQTLKGKTNSGQFKKGQKPIFFKGKYTSSQGYVFIYIPEHPFAIGRKKYVMEHRLVMEKHLGRYLLPTEFIHHINEIRNDNRIENLRLCSNNSEHRKLHRKEYKDEKECAACHIIKPLKNFLKLKTGSIYSYCYACVWLKTKARKLISHADTDIRRSI